MFSKRNLVASLLGATVFAHAFDARAQSCCAGGSALTPGRLTPHEDVLVGLQLRAQRAFGGFNARGEFRSAPNGSAESDFEENLVASVRLLQPMQMSLVVPVVQTYRRSAGVSEWGGGVGDLNLSARYELFLAGKYTSVPGIALLAGVSAPTGVPPDEADSPLATGATGIGAWQGHAGIAAEQVWGHWLVNVAGIFSMRSARTVSGVHSLLGPQATALLGAGYTFDNEAALAASLSYAFEMRAEVDGALVSNTARRSPQFGVSGLLPLGDHMRLSGGPTVHLPFLPGANQTTYVGFSITWVRTWT